MKPCLTATYLTLHHFKSQYTSIFSLYLQLKWHFTAPLEKCSICYSVPFSDSYFKLSASF